MPARLLNFRESKRIDYLRAKDPVRRRMSVRDVVGWLVLIVGLGVLVWRNCR